MLYHRAPHTSNILFASAHSVCSSILGKPFSHNTDRSNSPMRRTSTTRCCTSAICTVLLCLLLTATPQRCQADSQECSVDEPQRSDCGYLGITEQECTSNGCCWKPVEPNPDNVPWCYEPQACGEGGYRVTKVSTEGLDTTLELQLLGPQLPQYGADFETLTASLSMETPQRLHAKIAPKDVARWEVPESLIPRPERDAMEAADALYDVVLPSEEEAFALTVRRRDSDTALFDSKGYSLVFKDQYLQLTTAVPASASVYGPGETSILRTGFKLPRNNKIITLWAYDIGASSFEINTYGAHPFLLQVNEDGQSSGVFLLNSNGMDIILDQESITYKVIGGLLDLYIFAGPSPESVIQQYQEVIGRPAMPPYWSLGFHQCKWGYKTLDELKAVVEGYRQAAIPLETIWSDIDYMHMYRDFTFDDKRFNAKAMREFVDGLHAQGQHWVPITDCGIPNAPGDKAYEEGLAADVFIKDVTGQPYLGQVWPGPTHFPDFLHPKTAEWWTAQLQRMYELVPFSGQWIDMNEISNFCEGEVCKPQSWWRRLAGKLRTWGRHAPTSTSINCETDCQQPSPDNKLAFPPYAIHNLGSSVPLGNKAVPMTATHHNGAREYDAHNLYGLSEARATAAAIRKITGKRPFVLSRSTFPGLGTDAAHWTGDNAADWDNMRWSISGLLNSNLCDICGFFGDSNEELCARWISLGAFYTFSRDHSSINTAAQELYRWPATITAARKALGMRYRLLPYLYSSFYIAHTAGGTVAKPLFMLDPADAAARDKSSQFLFGDCILVSPVLEPGADSVTAYFPAGTWYSLWQHVAIDTTPQQLDADTGAQPATKQQPGSSEVIQGPSTQKLYAPLGDVPLHVRGGSIIAMASKDANTTAGVRAAPITLLLALQGSEGSDSSYTRDNMGSSSSDSSCGSMRSSKRTRHAYAQIKRCHQQQAGLSAHLASANVDLADVGSSTLLACGLLYLDDGESLEAGGHDSLEVWFASLALSSTRQGWLQSSGQGAQRDGAGSSASSSSRGEGSGGDGVIGEVRILGVQGSPGDGVLVTLNGQQLGHAPDGPQVAFDAGSHVLSVTNLALAAGQDMQLSWEVGLSPSAA